MTLTVYSLVVALSLSRLGCLIYHSRGCSIQLKQKINFVILIHKPGFLRAGHNLCSCNVRA